MIIRICLPTFETNGLLVALSSLNEEMGDKWSKIISVYNSSFDVDSIVDELVINGGVLIVWSMSLFKNELLFFFEFAFLRLELLVLLKE